MEIKIEEAKAAKVEAQAKLNQLLTRRLENEKRLSEIREATLTTGKPGRESDLTRQARAMLSGEVPENTAPLLAEKEILENELHILREAIRLQSEEVGRADRELSILVGTARLPEKKALILEHCRALIRVNGTIEKLQAFNESFREYGTSSKCCAESINYLMLLGSMSDRFSVVTVYLNDLIERGWISKAEVEAMKGAAKEGW
ncbi:MAG: hypothetical protein NTY86_14345 [Deltaproteobacteria bacterium]|nr:hypothetical protein [Deltaproteobacteria bacterium]